MTKHKNVQLSACEMSVIFFLRF